MSRSKENRTRRSSSSSSNIIKAELYKTEACRWQWNGVGRCRYKGKCRYAHDDEDLRKPPDRGPLYKTVPCKNYGEDGMCPYGQRCRFIHVEPEVPIPPVVAFVCKDEAAALLRKNLYAKSPSPLSECRFYSHWQQQQQQK